MASTAAKSSAANVLLQTCFCFLQAYSKIITDPEASVVLWLDSVVHSGVCELEELLEELPGHDGFLRVVGPSKILLA